MSPRRFALVAGGGTGGHVVPALALARAISEHRGPDSVELVGSRRGLDSELVRNEGFPATLLPGRGFLRGGAARGARFRAAAANLSACGQLAVAALLALVVVLTRRPSVVVAMGGYASVATALAAKVLRVPVVLVNVDAVPGAANRLIGKFADATAVAFEGTDLPRAVVTGAPVRTEIVRAARPRPSERKAARGALGVPVERRLVAVVGGSLGAGSLNDAVLDLALLWEHRADLAIYHVVGRRDFERMASTASKQKAAAQEPDRLWYRQVPYEERMPLFYEAADLVLCRSGANTVAELTVVGVPSVLVPLPRSPGDHQKKNASFLERAGAAVMIEDDELSANTLAKVLGSLFVDEKLASMREAAARLGRPDALDAVVRLVEGRARRRP